MNETTPAPETPETPSTPFGAGIPAEVVEPVRLPPGLAHGPALDVRGGQVSAPPPVASAPTPPPAAAAYATPPPSAAPSGPSAAPSFATAPPPEPPPAGAPIPPSAPIPPATTKPKRWWIGLAHLLFLVPFPFGVVTTAALWIWRRERDALMADQGREAINMQLTFWLALGILGATCLASPLVPFVYVLGAVLCLLAAISAGSGERHRYPWVFRFLT